MIQTTSQLERYLKTINSDSRLAIDTEFKRINTYYPQLCLVQIATTHSLECIDVLSINDLEPLFEKLYRSKTEWIVHSARQDIEAFYHLSKRIPVSLFDTQIAASLLNYPLQISYQLITEVLQDIQLDKSFTRFDWTTRPLPADVVEYALDDVRYLLPNFEKLKHELTISKKIQWLDEETRFLLDQDLYEPSIEKICYKTKGLSQLGKKFQDKAIKLAAWRENNAQQKNKPRKWIMSDEKLLDYACGKNKLSTRSEKLFDNFVKDTSETFTLSKMLTPQKPLTRSEKSKKNELQRIINSLGEAYNLPPEVISTSKSLIQFIRGDLSAPLCGGWRAKLFNKEK
uniref:Ribonuclease D, putative n=1 Tax=uncultured marine bacterium 583 TaxID=257403 RepID=Q6SET5_9BACT|nr:ribonuclease D, putative [uncultured marine bacterium 583]